MTVECRICGEDYVVSCTDAQYLDWKGNHRLIQHAMPDVSPDERELLISGTCGACFAELLPPEEDDE